MRVDCRILIDTYVMLAKCKITKVAKLRVAFWGWPIAMDNYIQDVTPKVVAMAVRIVMAMLMIFFQSSCLFMTI